MGELLNTVFTAIAPPELEAIRLLEREQRNQNIEVIPVRASFSSPPPINLNAAQIRHVGEANVVYNNIHSHCPSCHKGDRGEIGCRLAYGRPCAGSVDPREIRLVRVLNQITNNVITVPRAFQLPYEHNAAEYIEYTGTDEARIVNDKLFKLSSPGFDDRLIEYPLHRPFISPNIDLLYDISPEDQTHLTRQLLERLYDRLVVMLSGLNFHTIPMPNNCTLQQLNALLNQMLRNLLFRTDNTDETIVLENERVLNEITQIFNSNERLLHFLDYLSLQNTLLGETNLPIAASVGSCFNSQALTSQEAAMAAIFYLIDYVTKDSMKPADLLGFIQAARLRFQTYPGQAPDGENPEENNRPARRLMQIIQNGIAGSVEISVQQCVLNIAGLPSHDSSENFSFIFTNSAIRAMRLSINNYSGPITSPPIRRRRFETLPQPAVNITEESEIPLVLDPFAANDFEYQNNMQPVGTTHRNTANELVTTCQDLEYLHRGEELSFLSLIEYACVIKRVRITEREDTNRPQQSGRRPNGVFPFASGYPLTDTFEQRQKSKQSIPVFGGNSSVPTWPSFRAVGRRNNNISANEEEEEEENTFENEQETFAEFILVMFRPWPAPNYVHSNYQESFVQQLNTFLSCLMDGNHLKNIQTNVYHAPIGFNLTIVPNTQESLAQFSNYEFNQQNSAKFIGIYIYIILKQFHLLICFMLILLYNVCIISKLGSWITSIRCKFKTSTNDVERKSFTNLE